MERHPICGEQPKGPIDRASRLPKTVHSCSLTDAFPSNTDLFRFAYSQIEVWPAQVSMAWVVRRSARSNP